MVDSPTTIYKHKLFFIGCWLLRIADCIEYIVSPKNGMSISMANIAMVFFQ